MITRTFTLIPTYFYSQWFSILLSLSALFALGCSPKARAERDPHTPSSQPYQGHESDQTSSKSVKDDMQHNKLIGAWGDGQFGKGIDPVKLHQPSRDEGVAIFAGGCFWCMEAPFEKLQGVVSVHSGYTGGDIDSPTYGQVSASRTKHLEAVIVYYRPSEISYDQLLTHYWQSINPIQADGQFADRGLQYTTAIFTVSQIQRNAAIQAKQVLDRSGKFKDPIAVKIRDAKAFWPAESYHQDYYKTNTEHYLRYKHGSGRAAYLKQTWGVE